MKNVCIFDLDGTLLDTLESLYVSVNITLQELNLGAITREQCRAYIGNGARYLMEQSILGAHPRVGDEKREESACNEELLTQGMNIYKRVFAENCTYKVEPYVGIRGVLDTLKKEGFTLAILSNKPHQRTVEIADEFFGAGYFGYVQGQCDTIPRKPDPDSLRYVIEKLGVDKDVCVYIGDAETDLATGMGAEVTTIGVSWGFRDREVLEHMNPTLILDRPLQILESIKHMNEG